VLETVNGRLAELQELRQQTVLLCGAGFEPDQIKRPSAIQTEHIDVKSGHGKKG
jgi:hypothetical protein